MSQCANYIDSCVTFQWECRDFFKAFCSEPSGPLDRGDIFLKFMEISEELPAKAGSFGLRLKAGLIGFEPI